MKMRALFGALAISVLTGAVAFAGPPQPGTENPSSPPTYITYAMPNAQQASSSAYAASAGYAANAGNANHANTANSATSCTGTPTQCGSVGSGPGGGGGGPTQYQGIYGTRTANQTSCGGTAPTTPTLAQAQGWYNSQSQVPGNYVQNTSFAAGCWGTRFGHPVFISGGIKTYYTYPLTGYNSR